MLVDTVHSHINIPICEKSSLVAPRLANLLSKSSYTLLGLRTPLNAVIGFSDGLLKRVGLHPLNEHQLDRIRRIKSSGEYLLTLISGVLGISTLEAGKTRIDLTQFAIDELADDVVRTIEGLLQ